MRVRVEAYAGYRAEERPLRFTLQDHSFEVREILDRWYGPAQSYFKVRADDGNIYLLRYDSVEDEWSLEMFRQSSLEAPILRAGPEARKGASANRSLFTQPQRGERNLCP